MLKPPPPPLPPCVAPPPAHPPQDFGGFRVLVLLPRYKSHWPSPISLSKAEGTKAHPKLGASKGPFPFLQTHGKPLSAATIRSGPGYLEIPFVATHETKRGRGYCRSVSLAGGVERGAPGRVGQAGLGWGMAGWRCVSEGRGQRGGGGCLCEGGEGACWPA